MRKMIVFFLVGLSMQSANTCWSSAGKEGASFLDIPVGAAPAALGGAYSALAFNAYAPVYNPAGTGLLDHSELTAQHLSYLDSIHYDFLSFVHPIYRGFGLGASIQYLGSGNIPRTDGIGNPLGSYSSAFAAYTLTVGRHLGDQWAIGASGKVIRASISDFQAQAYAGDAGVLGQINSHLTVAGVASNVGTRLTFDQVGDRLPETFRLSAAYQYSPVFLESVEGVYQPQDGLSWRTGIQWNAMSGLFLRAGYRTDTLKELSALAGITVGIGLNILGHEISYAWLPVGELGSTHYFSLVLRWGEAERARRNLVYVPHHRLHERVQESDPEIPQLIELLNYSDSSKEAKLQDPKGTP